MRISVVFEFLFQWTLLLTFWSCLTVDLRTIGISDSPIIVDQSPPVAGVVYDGDHLGEDLVYMKDNDKVIIISQKICQCNSPPLVWSSIEVNIVALQYGRKFCESVFL